MLKSLHLAPWHSAK